MRTSYSALDTYKTCPLKFKFQELDKIRVPKNIDAIFGSTVHSTLKYMFERTPLYPTLDEIMDFFRIKWTASTQILEDKKESELRAYLDDGIKIITNFYKKNPPWNFNAVDLESRFAVEIEDPKTKEVHTLAGIIDRVDKNPENGFCEIIDYKTAKRMPAQNIIDQNLQMAIYQIGLSKKWPHLSPNNIKLSFYFLKHGEKISTQRTQKQLEETKENVISTINEIEENIKNDDFSPLPSPLCDWCGYKKMCPMWKHDYRVESEKLKVESGQIEEIIKEYFEIKEQDSKNTKRLGELKTLINNFMDNQKLERVFGNEGHITRNNQERSSYDMEKVCEILEPAGKLNQILSVDEKKLKKIFSSLPTEIQNKIKECEKIKQFSVLTASKKQTSPEK